MKFKYWALTFFTAVLLGMAAFSPISQEEQPDWWKNWGLMKGFSIEEAANGFKFPTRLAFISDPGPGPKAPVYFVTELKQGVKVVTRDGSILNFSKDYFEFPSDGSLEPRENTFGITGICLEEEKGFVFVTYSVEADNLLENRIVRFESQPKIFGTKAENAVEIGNIFKDFPTGVSHVIGTCITDSGALFVSVGDGRNQYTPPIGIDNTLGKILRMGYEGNPLPGNPFYDKNNPDAVEGYVWAYGFRNPYGLAKAGDALFTGDNGMNLDRLVKIKAGEDYLWDGSDWSIGAANEMAFSPSIAPTQLEYYSGDTGLFPPIFDQSFFMGIAADGGGIMNVPYELESGQALQAPRRFLRYLGVENHEYAGVVSAVSIGPDGIYFAPILGIDNGDSSVYRISFRPEKEHPYRPYDISNPEVMLHSKNCLSCHSLDGQGGTEGPSLDKEELVPRLNVRLNSAEYLVQLAAADLLAGRPFVETAQDRNMIRRSSGYERISLWVIAHLIEPKFDNPEAAMPNLNLSQREAKLLADYLLGKEGEVHINIFEVGENSSYNQAGGQTQGRLGKINLRDANTIISLLIGFLLGAATAAGATAWRKFRNRF